MSAPKDRVTSADLFSEVRQSKSQRAKSARRKLYHDFATRHNAPYISWSATTVIDFILDEVQSDDDRKIKAKKKPIENGTVLAKAAQLTAFLFKKGNLFMASGSSTRLKIANAISKLNQRRSYRFADINDHKQARTLTSDQLKQLMIKFTDEKISPNPLKASRQRAIILLLLFSHAAACRVADLSHTRWHSFELAKDEIGKFLRIKLAWIKNNRNANKKVQYELRELSDPVLCPVANWKKLARPMFDACPQGPFVSPRTNRPYDTSSVVTSWRRVAKKILGMPTDFSAHSGKRSAITAMFEAGMKSGEIGKKTNYAPKSKVMLIYNDKRNKQPKKTAKKEKDSKAFTKYLKAKGVKGLKVRRKN